MKSDFILLSPTDDPEDDVRRRAGAVVAMTAAVLACASCSTAGAPGLAGSTGSHVVRVVAAENFWGSVARQLGGAHVQVTSLVDNPDADPHDYEPTPADARAVAASDLVVVNGVGYDGWASRLVDANPNPDRPVLDVGKLVGAAAGDNPHRWYDPADVKAVAARLTALYQQLDPADGAEFERLAQVFGSTGTAAYKAVVADIRARFAGTAVGASESIFAMVAPALGLDLVTPPGFLKAVSQGTDPSAADKATADEQVAGRQIVVYVYNSQNATPDVQQQIAAADAAGIPVTTITETMVPATATWQQWQTTQLQALRAALARATGR